MEVYAQRFLEKITYERAVSPHTLRAYKADLKVFLSFCEKNNIKTVNSFEPSHISLWLEELNHHGLSPRSVARKMATAGSFFHFMIDNKIIEKNHFVLFRSPKARKTSPLVVSQNEIFSVLENLPENSLIEKRNKIIFFTLYGTGLRSEELCCIKIKDIFWDRDVLYVLGKGNKERIVPLLPFVKKNLKKWEELRPFVDQGLSSAFFLSHRGKALETSLIRKLTSELPFNHKHFHPHAFRYTFASHLLENNANLRCIQELLGHRKLATTERYTKIGMENLKREYQRFHPHA